MASSKSSESAPPLKRPPLYGEGLYRSYCTVTCAINLAILSPLHGRSYMYSHTQLLSVFIKLSVAGHVGTTQQECEDSGCCWQPKDVIIAMVKHVDYLSSVSSLLLPHLFYMYASLFSQNNLRCSYPSTSYSVSAVRETTLGYQVGLCKIL